MMAPLYASASVVWIFILRILFACVCGGAIGFERTRRLKEAGIRTHCIIAAASALLMILSKYGFSDLESAGVLYAGTKGADPARIAAQIVSGISFLGAGVIFKNGSSVKGLTTAAGIWATAAVGMAFGCGMWVLGLVQTILIVAIQLLFHRFSIGNDAYSDSDIRIVANDSANFRESFLEMTEKRHIQVINLKIDRHDDGCAVYSFSIRTRRDFTAADVIGIFAENPEIRSISM